jgi:Transposase DDE domain
VRTTKSPRRVLWFAYIAGKLALPLFSHRFSPKTFTQPQLFACLALKEFLRLDYRKLEALLQDAPDLCDVIELSKVPHFTTFQKAAQRLLLAVPARRLLDETIEIGVALHRQTKRVDLAALDGTGFESRHASTYYVRRRANTGKYWQKLTYRTFPKAGLLCDCASHMILAVVPGHGPGPDSKHYRAALDQARARVRLKTLAADAGYDSEESHRYARNECGIRTLIPALIGRPTNKLPSGYWRRQMATRLHTTRYTQRWQVETVNSMFKRLLDSALRARKRWNQYREIVLRSLTLNLMILRRRVFYTARMSLSPPSFSPTRTFSHRAGYCR